MSQRQISELLPEPKPWTVKQLMGAIKLHLQASFKDIWVVGEVSSLTKSSAGHYYFNLKDEDSLLKVAFFRADAARAKFALTDGLRVLCRGGIDIYAAKGDCQFVVRQMEVMGEGHLQLAFRKLHDRLSKEGLFDPRHKKPIPKFPRLVLLITSPTGAAVRDFLEIARRRWTLSRIVLFPSGVQNASTQIAETIRQANRIHPRPDVIVLARGGGSMEDLWCFNEEEVVRAIFASEIPLVTAIGHEIDVTLSDLVADIRALTPSEAAERIFPDRDELRFRIDQTARHLVSLIRGQLHALKMRLQGLAYRPALARPRDLFVDSMRRLDELDLRGKQAVRRAVQDTANRVTQLAARLEALSPLKVLVRGYSVTQLESTGEIIKDAVQIQPGDRLRHRFATGGATSVVENLEKSE